MSKRLDELYKMRATIDKEIDREQAHMLRMAQLRDVCHELLAEPSEVTTATVRTMAAAYDLEVSALFGHDRTRHLVMARQILFKVLRNQGLSYPEIGRLTGRDHTTVMHGCRKVDADPTLTAAVEAIKQKLAAAPAIELAEVS